MSREQTKAAHYIKQLDEARCDGNWDAVPELVRKIKKHAPGRTCLTLTAEAEHAVTQASRTRPATARPSTTRPSTASSGQTPTLSRYIPLLLDAIEKERTYVEDDFQAQVCLGWIHWHLGEPALAAARLPKSIEADFSQLDGTNKESAEWSKVCALKASYIKGNSQRRTGAVAEALETFESSLPVLSSVSAAPRHGRELKSWTELYLTGFCMISSHAIKSKVTSLLETETLTAFRSWAKFWEFQTSTPPGGRALEAEVSRRQVWREYYVTLSDLLQQELPFPTTALTVAYAETSTRLQQRAELKRVEARYEALLLSEVQFPKADQGREEIEDFVEIVMQNWRILCGSSWKEHDLGEGGAEAVSRGVLDILYRAATKTFHSTAILRYLFTAHLAVAEFDLAFKAFDTYLEIIKKGKARVEKSGEPEQALDDDETVLGTASECIKALCRYGSLQGAEKARELGQFFEEWLDKHHPTEQRNENGRILENGNSTGLKNITSPRIFAIAWRCIGISHAQWARVTFDAAARGEIQLRAIKCFRKALAPEYESTKDVGTLFALGVILAERRELSAAIDIVKSGLLPAKSLSSELPRSLGPHPVRFARERSLIPLWHLMALLLSARQEFMTAARSCEGAFEQFQDPKYLFGETDLNGAYRSDHLNEKSAGKQGVVDDMDDFEKENVLEVKMTQLALIEVLEGPEVAVNASDELLSLYTRLFGDPLKDTSSASPKPALTVPPKSSAGTIRSIKGSIFGRSSRSIRKSQTIPSANEKTASLIRPHTSQTVASTGAPTIQVTNENGSTAKQGRQPLTRERSQHHHEKLQKRSNSVSRSKSGSIRARSSSTGRVANTSAPVLEHRPTTVDGEKFFTPPVDTDNRDQWLSDGQRPDQVGLAMSSNPDNASPTSSPVKDSRHSTPPKPLAPQSQQTAQKETSLKSANPNPAIAQDSRLPQVSPYLAFTNPVTRFPKDQERRRRISILVKVWLLISGFYRRASMYDDAKGAIEEAQKLVKNVELEVATDSNGNVSIKDAGWGGGKCVAELWGDVFSERGYLAAAESTSYVALSHFESALTHFADHPSGTVGLSNVLLDIYTEDLLPPPSTPPLVLPHQLSTPSASTLINANTSATPTPAPATQPINSKPASKPSSKVPIISHGPLGLPSAPPLNPQPSSSKPKIQKAADATHNSATETNFENKEPSTALLDRLAARDRAYGLLSGLTKLGTGWNYSEAWFALARAYELGEQPDKAREVLWWCVELEEGKGVREWSVVGGGGYVL